MTEPFNKTRHNGRFNHQLNINLVLKALQTWVLVTTVLIICICSGVFVFHLPPPFA